MPPATRSSRTLVTRVADFSSVETKRVKTKRESGNCGNQNKNGWLYDWFTQNDQPVGTQSEKAILQDDLPSAVEFLGYVVRSPREHHEHLLE